MMTPRSPVPVSIIVFMSVMAREMVMVIEASWPMANLTNCIALQIKVRERMSVG